jgi:hypothetical protein
MFTLWAIQIFFIDLICIETGHSKLLAEYSNIDFNRDHVQFANFDQLLDLKTGWRFTFGACPSNYQVFERYRTEAPLQNSGE